MSIDAASADAKNPVSQITGNTVAHGDAADLEFSPQSETSTTQRVLCVKTVSHADLPDLVALDQRCLGGIWSLEGYGREVDSPNSDLIVLSSLLHNIEDPVSELSPPTRGQSTANPPSALAPSAPFLGLGCLWSILEEAHITLLGVDPAYRRQGLGQLLLYVLLTCAQQRGLERATLEVRVSNQGAIALYEQFGFRRAGCRRRYYPDDEDALILWLNGLHHPEFDRNRQQWWSSIQAKLKAAGWSVKIDDSLPLVLDVENSRDQLDISCKSVDYR